MYNRELEDKSFNEVQDLSVDEILEKIRVVEYKFDLLKLKISRYCNENDIDVENAKVGDYPDIRDLANVMADLMTIVLGYTRAVIEKKQK